MKLKIVFLGTPEFAVPSLKKLIETQKNIIAVYTQPDRPAGRGQKLSASPIKQLATTQSIPVFQPESFKNLQDVELLRNLAPDLLVVVAYGLLLPKSVLSIAPLGAINVHPSLLPRWRGSTPIQSSILAGDYFTGVSIIRLTQRMDAGPVLMQTQKKLSFNETSGQLHNDLSEEGAELLLSTIQLLENNSDFQGFPQEEKLATYTRKIIKEDAHVNWGMSAIELERSIRAYNPWPIAFTQWHDKTLRIWEAHVISTSTVHTPGTVIKAIAEGIEVATGAGMIRLSKVQLPGGKPLEAAEFFRGYGNLFKPGTTLL